MSRHHITHFTVEWGDCDPARIVFYPNYFRWMDAASLRYFRAVGVPPWHEFEAQSGILGTPLVDASARFVRPASYGDAIDIDTVVDEWRRKSFVMSHIIQWRRAGGRPRGPRVRAAASGGSLADPGGGGAGERPQVVRVTHSGLEGGGEDAGTDCRHPG